MREEKPFKLLARLPKGDANGLETVYDQLKNHGTAYVLMRVSSPEVTLRIGDVREPKLVIDRIEGLPPNAPDMLEAAAERLMRLARRARGIVEVHQPSMFDSDDDEPGEAEAPAED